MTTAAHILRVTMRSAILAGLLLGNPSLVAARQDRAEPPPTGTSAAIGDQEVAEAFSQRDYARALRLLEALVEQRGQEPFVMYNLACARAMLGDHDAAAETLIDAIAVGFVDLHHAQRDPHLEPIRNNAKYRLIMLAWRELLNARGSADLRAAMDALGETYRAEQDEQTRLSFVWAMDPKSFEDAREEVRRVSDWAAKNVLGDAAMAPINVERPDPWVMILLPTPRDFARLVLFGGVGGYYDRDLRRLVTQDIGPSLRHEFFHVLHWRHMDRIGQRHPLWIMEGLACLLEDVDVDADGEYVLTSSWRTNIAKRLERANRLTPWKTLFEMPRDGFMGDRARANYAQARCIFMFLHDQGVLKVWYDAYVGSYAQDPSGAQAIEQTLDAPLKDVERRFRAWLRDLPDAGEQARPGEAGLGVRVGPGAGDGVMVLQVVAGSRARVVGQERLQRRDVITAIDGRTVRTLDDLHRVLAENRIGERVQLDVRRGAQRLRVEMELVPTAADEDQRLPF